MSSSKDKEDKEDRLIDPSTGQPIFPTKDHDDAVRHVRETQTPFAGCKTIGDFVMTMRIVTSPRYDSEKDLVDFALAWEKSPYYIPDPHMSVEDFYNSKYATPAFLEAIKKSPDAVKLGLWPPPPPQRSAAAAERNDVTSATSEVKKPLSDFELWKKRNPRYLAGVSESDIQWRYQMTQMAEAEDKQRRAHEKAVGYRPHWSTIQHRASSGKAKRRANAELNKNARYEATIAEKKQNAIAETARLNALSKK